MKFIISMIITFIIFTFFAILINFCKKRVRETKHGLTGMCHKDGGAICSTCIPKKNTRTEAE